MHLHRQFDAPSRSLAVLVMATTLALTHRARAQQTPAIAPETPPVETPPPATAAPEQPPVAASTQPAEVTTKAEPVAGPEAQTLEDRVTTLEAKVEGAEESATEVRGIVERHDKLKFSGYAQGRFERHEDSKNGLNSSNRPATTTQFLVRRARLKSTSKGTYASSFCGRSSIRKTTS